MCRSLRVRPDCTEELKGSLLRNGFPTQRMLAEYLQISQGTVSNFLNGKPISVVIFMDSCRALNCEWRDVVDVDYQAPHQQESYQAGISREEPLHQAGIGRGESPLEVAIVADRSVRSSLAGELEQVLRAKGYQVLMAEENALLAENLLSQCDYLLLLLSPEGAVSEIVLEEVRQAWQLRDTARKPAILPICIDLLDDAVFNSELLSYLEGVPLWYWHSASETRVLAEEISIVLKEGRILLPADHRLAIRPSDLQPTDCQLPPVVPSIGLELPQGLVPVDSPFYIDRYPIEERCYQAIAQPGQIIRIKAPRQQGKTSLMARILHNANNQGFRATSVSLQLANKKVFDNSDRFLQWFCASVSQKLGLWNEEGLTECWELARFMASSICCKTYFENYILSKLSAPLVLGLDEVDKVFPYSEIANDFFGLLRSLHEEAKMGGVWRNFRLVIVHSTEIYIPLDVNSSPFNVGLAIDLPDFTPEQVQNLAARHELSWGDRQVRQLMEVVGGHPYLVRLALYRIACQDVTLDRVLDKAATEEGLYQEHLRRHLWNLEKYPELLEAMREVAIATSPVQLPSELAFKLESIGLVKLQGNNCTPRYDLYARYFRERLGSSSGSNI